VGSVPMPAEQRIKISHACVTKPEAIVKKVVGHIEMDVYSQERRCHNVGMRPDAPVLRACSQTERHLLLKVTNALTPMQLLVSPMVIWLQSLMLACQAATSVMTGCDGWCPKYVHASPAGMGSSSQSRFSGALWG